MWRVSSAQMAAFTSTGISDFLNTQLTQLSTKQVAALNRVSARARTTVVATIPS